MKVKSLFIKDYNQFKDFSLDLTYPKGHKKAGQPLDKVCVIGQSGTGKTSLLRFVEYMNRWKENILVPSPSEEKKIVSFQPSFEPLKYVKSYSEFFFGNSNDISSSLFFTVYDAYAPILSKQKDDLSGKDFFDFEGLHDFLSSIRYKTIFVQAEQKADFALLESEPSFKTLYGNEPIIDDFVGISPVMFNTFWQIIKNDAKVFQINLLNKRNEFSKLVTDLKTSQSQIQKEVEKLRNWEENQVNPLKKLADECLDKILSNFNLKIKTEVDFEDIGFIKVETLQGKEVENDLLSTGVKQILLTALPLYTLKPKNSVILFDEPERSLYPDIQTQIVDIYSGLTEDCQFFYATHSPIVASSFEPWEIVELKFKEDGTVYRELYYDESKENHVDNYFINPQYLRWDSILTKIFDLDMDSNPERTKKLMELAKIRSKIKKMNGSATPEEKQELMLKFEKLANLLDWEFDEKN